MSFDSVRDTLAAQFADSVSPEGAGQTPTTPTEGQTTAVQTAVTETPVTTTETPVTPPITPTTPPTTPPLDPNTIRHGARIGDLLVIDPNRGVDLTQFESGRKMQARISELERRAREAEEKVIADTAKSEKTTRLNTLNKELREAKTEKERMAAVVRYKDWERGQTQAELDRLKTAQTQQEEANEVDSIIADWDDYYEKDMGLAPDFLNAVNVRAKQAANGNPVAYQNIRHTVIADVVARAARGEITSPFRQAGTPAQTTQTPATPAASTQTTQVQTPPPGAVTPSGSNVGQPDLMDMFFNGDMKTLRDTLNIRR